MAKVPSSKSSKGKSSKKKVKCSVQTAKRLPKNKKLSQAQQMTLQEALARHQRGQSEQAWVLIQPLLQAGVSNDLLNYWGAQIALRLGQKEIAAELISRALELNSKELKLLAAGAELAKQLRRYDDAITWYQKALSIKPRDLALSFDLATTYWLAEEHLKALKAYEQADAYHPDHPKVLASLTSAQLQLCLFDQAMRTQDRYLNLQPDDLVAVSSNVMSSNYRASWSPEQQFQYHLEKAKSFPSPVSLSSLSGAGSGLDLDHKTGAKKLCIGLVSSDFRFHSVAYFVEPLLKHLDRSRYSIRLYHNYANEDDKSRELASLADAWLNTSKLSDEALRNQIMSDQVDILVDLNGHTAHNRLAVFAQRAAPVQVSWLGYPNTTALPAMDYRIVDEDTDPAGTYDGLATEQLLRLPNGFLCYELPEERPSVGAPLPAEEFGVFTFGSFNNVAKFNESVVSSWARILKAVPNSRLFLKARGWDRKAIRERYLSAFEAQGVDSERIVFAPFVRDVSGHLDVYQQVDLALDTFPYHGTTTTCEALSQGVPVVSFWGDRHAARVGPSLLKQAGLPELIGDDLDAYEQLAIDLSSDLSALKKLRKKLLLNLGESALCDAKAFVNDMSEAFDKMAL